MTVDKCGYIVAMPNAHPIPLSLYFTYKPITILHKNETVGIFVQMWWSENSRWGLKSETTILNDNTEQQQSIYSIQWQKTLNTFKFYVQMFTYCRCLCNTFEVVSVANTISNSKNH